MRRWLALLLICGAGTAGAEEGAAPEPAHRFRKVAVIPIEGALDAGMTASVARRIAEAKAASCDALFFEVDTEDGNLAQAQAISDAMASVDWAPTICYVPSKALSAGTLLALSARELHLGPAATLGGCQPILTLPGFGGISTGRGMGETTQSKLRASLANLARRLQAPERLAEAFVTESWEVHRVAWIDGSVRYLTPEDLAGADPKAISSDQVVDRADTLLTLTASQALSWGFARSLPTDRDALLRSVGVPPGQRLLLERSWSERLVRALEWLAPVFLIVGLLGLVAAFKMPGHGLPEVIAALGLGLCFGGQYLAGMASWWEIGLFGAGILLIALELFLFPGYGILLGIGALTALTGLVLAFQPQRLIPQTLYDWGFLGRSTLKLAASFGATMIGAVLLARVLPQAPYFRRLSLQAVSSGSALTSPDPGLLGRVGTATTVLRPAGKIELDGKVLDAVSESEFIEPGKPVRVTSVSGGRIVVRSA